MEKTDLRKLHRSYYSATATPVIVSFPAVNYISITGSGYPGDELFRQQTEALYQLAYGIKKKLKSQGADFTVPPLEGLWWKDDNRQGPKTGGLLKWQLMIRMPEGVTVAITEEAKTVLGRKKGAGHFTGIFFNPVPAGQFAHLLHIGTYQDEGHSINRLTKYILDSGFAINGRHHEIYLSDPRKTAADQLKTIIRYLVINNKGPAKLAE